MTLNSRKDYLNSWNLQQANEKPMITVDNDDDQDIYISERSSVESSSNDMNQTLSSVGKRVPTPATSSIVSVPQKQPHTTLRYHSNELLENGLPIATQVQLQRKEEKTKKKTRRKATPVQEVLTPFPETKPSELNDNHYPYWCYYKVKNPDWIMRHRQPVDGQIISHESLDPLQCSHQPALTTLPIKPRQQPRKVRHNQVPINQDKRRLDHSENNSTTSSHLISHENSENNHQKQTSLSKQCIPLKDSDHDEHRTQPSKPIISHQRRKPKTENDWTDNYMQSLSNGKSSQDSNSLIITSNSMVTRPKNRSKVSDRNSVITDIDENGKHRHHQHSHNYHHQNQNQAHNSPSIAAQQTHHHHHHHHPSQNLHIRRRPPSGAYLGSELHVVDVSFKKSDRLPYLPPIIRDHHPHKTNTPRFPTEYYGTLARQAHGKDWEESMDVPKLYKPDPQARLYDRYINNVVDKRLAV